MGGLCKKLGTVFCVLVWVMLSGCFGGSSSGGSSGLSESEVASVLEDRGYHSGNVTKVRSGGGTASEKDPGIGNVLLFRISGVDRFSGENAVSFGNDIGFAFELLSDELEALPDTIQMVLYLDTDNNVGTGLQISGIGADIRLAPTGNRPQSSGVAEWDSAEGGWSDSDSWGGGCCGSANFGTEEDHGADYYAGIRASSELLSEGEAKGVFRLEIFNEDGTYTETVLAETEPFEVSLPPDDSDAPLTPDDLEHVEDLEEFLERTSE